MSAPSLNIIKRNTDLSAQSARFRNRQTKASLNSACENRLRASASSQSNRGSSLGPWEEDLQGLDWVMAGPSACVPMLLQQPLFPILPQEKFAQEPSSKICLTALATNVIFA